MGDTRDVRRKASEVLENVSKVFEAYAFPTVARNLEERVADMVDRELAEEQAMLCRWVDGEVKASAMWDTAVMTMGEEGTGLMPGELAWPPELVALGLVVVTDDPGQRPFTIWHELVNSAPIDSPTFWVSGSDVHAALSDVRARVDSDALSVLGGVLWHSHYRSPRPSRLDIRAFPTWYAKVGIVYHAPTGGSRAYNDSGELDQVSLSSTRATGR